MDKPYLEDVQVARFQRGSVKFFWKQSYDTKDFKSTSFLQKKAEKSVKTLFPPAEKLRGIDTAKKQNIAEKIYVHLDQNQTKFWEDMQTNDLSKDLTTERDSAEIEEEN